MPCKNPPFNSFKIKKALLFLITKLFINCLLVALMRNWLPSGRPSVFITPIRRNKIFALQKPSFQFLWNKKNIVILDNDVFLLVLNWLRRQELNLWSSGYEPDEIPLLHSAIKKNCNSVVYKIYKQMVRLRGIEPRLRGWKPRVLTTRR